MSDSKTVEVQESVFDEQQLEEIEAGREAGLDVACYASPDYHALEMRQLRLGLMAGLDVSVYADGGYDWQQMEELRLGMEQGLDVSTYATPALTEYQMRQFRKAMLQGHDLSAYQRFPAEILRQIRKAKRSGVDLDPFLEGNYSAGQLEQVRLALENGTDLSPYIDKGYEPEALREIRLGVEAGLDISVYEKKDYNWRQMRELRLGVMRRVDVSRYADSAYHWQQMRELRQGMEAGLDVRCYENVKLSPTDMRRIRKEIMAQLPQEPPSQAEPLDRAESPRQTEQEIHTEQPRQAESPCPPAREKKTADELMADIEKQLSDIHIEGVEEIAEESVLSLQMEVRISEDQMCAYLTVPWANSHRYTVGELIKVLMEQNVVYGVNQEAISRLIAEEMYDEEILVAEGTPVKKGDDGYYEFMFRTDIPTVPQIRPDGSVDYRNVQFFEYIKAGDVVAVYHHATAGASGCTVTGRVLPAQNGLEQQVLTGKQIHADADNVTYVADASGKIELKDNEIVINNVLEVDEVTYSTGNVRFEGSVHVKGNVSTGVLVEAGEDIVIDGNVEGATIRCGRNLLLKRGVLGGGICHIHAEGDITGKFFENADVYATGDISGNYILNCNTYAGGCVTILGRRGVVVGGYLQAVHGLSVQNLGNRAEVGTYIGLGISEAMLKQRKILEEALTRVQAELAVFYKAKSQFEQKYDLALLKTTPMYVKIEKAIAIKDSELRKNTQERLQILEQMKDLAGVKAQIRGEVFEGVTVTINGYVWQARYAKYLELHVEGDHVGLFTYDGKQLQSNTK